MPVSEAITAVADWLANQLPGGKWILPHWQDGPFWLVPVRNEDAANWQVCLLLDVYPPLVQGLPVVNDGELVAANVYAVPAFVYDMLQWHHDAESDFDLLYEVSCGPYDTLPTARDVVTVLPELLDVAGVVERGEQVIDPATLADLMGKLTRADPSTVLRSIATLDVGNLNKVAQYAETILSTAAGLSA